MIGTGITFTKCQISVGGKQQLHLSAAVLGATPDVSSLVAYAH